MVVCWFYTAHFNWSRIAYRKSNHTNSAWCRNIWVACCSEFKSTKVFPGLGKLLMHHEWKLWSFMDSSLNRKLKCGGSITSVNISSHLLFVVSHEPVAWILRPERLSLRVQKQAFWRGQTEQSVLSGRLWFLLLSTKKHQPSKRCKLIKHLWFSRGRKGTDSMFAQYSEKYQVKLIYEHFMFQNKCVILGLHV